MQDQPFRGIVPRRYGVSDFLSSLEAYTRASVRLAEHWPETDNYDEVRRQIEAIREHGMAMPALTVLSLQLVIAHCELVSTLWQHASAPVSAAALLEVRGRHAIAIDALRIAAAELHGGP